MADQDVSRVEGPPQPFTQLGLPALREQDIALGLKQGPPPIQFDLGELVVVEDVRNVFADVFVDTPDTSNTLPAFPDAIMKEVIPAIKAEPVNGVPPVRDEF
ncbi:MAG: hypothetical protein Q8P68_05865 [Candidatus Peregrinibacteria bacterium]|nr:hypothetical protein [Candidatus Peregrinibacteria bacterium]MDZ4244965.1 hypothetical protein [Candidatus Gracilibacteria bacterium]